MPRQFVLESEYGPTVVAGGEFPDTNFVILDLGKQPDDFPTDLSSPNITFFVTLTNEIEAEGGEDLILIPDAPGGQAITRNGIPQFTRSQKPGVSLPGQTIPPGGTVEVPLAWAKPNLGFENLGPADKHIPGFYQGAMRLTWRWASDPENTVKTFVFVCRVTITDQTPENTPTFNLDAFRQHVLAYYSNGSGSYPADPANPRPWGGDGLPRGDFYSFVEQWTPNNRQTIRQLRLPILMHMWIGNMRDPNGDVNAAGFYTTAPIVGTPGQNDFLFGNVVNWLETPEHTAVIQWGIDNNWLPAELTTPEQVVNASIEYLDSMLDDGDGGLAAVEIYEGSMRGIPQVILSEPANGGNWKTGWSWYKKCYDFYLKRPSITLQVDAPYGSANDVAITEGPYAGNTSYRSRRGWAEGGRNTPGQSDYFTLTATNIFQFYNHIKNTQIVQGKKIYSEPLTARGDHEWSVQNGWHKVAIHNSAFAHPNLHGPASGAAMSLTYQDSGDMTYLDGGTGFVGRRVSPPETPEYVASWFDVQRSLKISQIVIAIEYSRFTGFQQRAALSLWLYDALIDDIDNVIDEIQQILNECHSVVAE